jgi:hypothetical protein
VNPFTAEARKRREGFFFASRRLCGEKVFEEIG